MPTTDPMPADLAAGDLSTGVLASAGSGAPGTLVARLLACRDAEDYFAALDLPFDSQVLQVNRLHILRLFAPALQEYLGSTADAEPQAAQRLREALAAAHGTFTASTALDHRLFKVLRDRAPRSFVPLDGLTVEPPVPPADPPADSSADDQEATR